MNNLKKTHELIRQNEQIVKKSQKHDANLQKNSTLYFQVGLIVCLLAAYGLFEMKFETSIPTVAKFLPPDDPTEISVDNFKVEEPKSEAKPQVQKKVLLVKPPVIIDNDNPMKDIGIETPDTKNSTDSPIDPRDVNVIDEPVNVNIPINFIQKVPIYPGCEKSKNNFERKKCMSKKITKLIQRKFNGSDIAVDYGLTGIQKIDVEFTIDKTGHVTNIKTRSPHPKLDEEAERVIKIIPEMTPGKQNNKNVGVIYNLPIRFQVQ